MESEQTRLDQVLKMIGYLHQHFSGVADADVKRVMLDGLEKRFADYDQPALVLSYILNPQRQVAFLNPECPLVQWRNLVKLADVLYHRFFPEAQKDTGIADQFLQYLNKEGSFEEGAQLMINCLTALHALLVAALWFSTHCSILCSEDVVSPISACNRALQQLCTLLVEPVAHVHAATMKYMTKPGTLPQRLWNMVKKIAPELSQLAIRFMAKAVNAAGCERIFSQMGLTHTKVRNRLGFAKTTHIAHLGQELQRHTAVRKKARVVASASASDTQPKPLTDSTSVTHTAEDQLMDLDALTTADEFRLAVNEWFGDLDAEDRLAGMDSFPG